MFRNGKTSVVTAKEQGSASEKPSEPADKPAGEKEEGQKNEGDKTPKEEAPKKQYEKGTIDKPSAKGINVPCTGMKNARCKQEHEVHWVEVGAKNQKEYDQKAIDLISSPVDGDIDGYLRKPRPGTDDKPVIVRFNRKTGELALGIPGSFFLTYYKAKYNEETGKSDIKRANQYFDALKKREG